MRAVAIVGLWVVFGISISLQLPERHWGCPAGKNVCIYPIDDHDFQCDTIFDFQVELAVPMGSAVGDLNQELKIQFILPSGSKETPTELFGSEVDIDYRTWDIVAFEDFQDTVPDNYTAHAIAFRNVVIPSRVGEGTIRVVVRARGVTTKVNWKVYEPTRRRAKNVVLFIGDGMSLPFIAAARLVSRGMSNGKYLDSLWMEKLGKMGLVQTAGVDSIITDSANSANAYNSGGKSSVNALGVWVDSGDDDFAHPKVELLAEHVKRKMNMSVGVVTTAEVQDATPAAVWAHTRRRDEKAAITAQAIYGCVDCVTPVVPDVLMGGGGRYFLPASSYEGLDMYEEYRKMGYTTVFNKSEMKKMTSEAQKILGIFHQGNMDVWLDRNVYRDNLKNPDGDPLGQGQAPTDQPDLHEMTMAAIEVLSKNENGFYLMVEAASIDKAAHALDIERAISDLIEMDNTIKMVQDWAKKNGDDTLILVTADHAHGFDVYGTVDTKIWKDNAADASDVENTCSNVTDSGGKLFQSRPDPVYGSPLRDLAIARRAAIGTYSRAGYPDFKDEDGDGFPDTWDVRTVLAAGMNNFPDHTQDFVVSTSVKTPARFSTAGAYVNNPDDDPNGIFITGNLDPFGSTGVHTMQDVGLFGYGPGSDMIEPLQDNTFVFQIMASALGVGMGGQCAMDQCKCNLERSTCFELLKPDFCLKKSCMVYKCARNGSQLCSTRGSVPMLKPKKGVSPTKRRVPCRYTYGELVYPMNG